MRWKSGFNSYQLKLWGCLFMLTDHIGYLLLPQFFFLRIIGRLAFPLFAFMLANGYRHTRSRGKYLLRLALFGALFQPVYALCMDTAMLNIFATLALGLLAIIAGQRLRGRFAALGEALAWLSALLIGLLAQAVGADYGLYGVLLIFSAERFFTQKEKLAISWLSINALTLTSLVPLAPTQVFSLLALPLIYAYNGERGRGSRWLFYAFYVLHIPLLYLIRLAIGAA